MALGEFQLSDEDFVFIAKLVKAKTGIVLDIERKRNLVYNRLARRLRQLEMKSFNSYTDFLQSAAGKGETIELVNVITTNLTKFFREDHHFDHLKKELKQLSNTAKDDRLRIWSAGSSSGEEAYSIAMTLYEAIPGIKKWDAKILATDIDTNMLDTGKAGKYGLNALKTIPEEYLKKYTTPPSGDSITVVQKLRDLIHFKYMNFLEPWPCKGPFDFIFCRNVIIYFDKETKEKLVNQFAQLLKPGGILYLGHSENILGASDEFESQGKTIYMRTV